MTQDNIAGERSANVLIMFNHPVVYECFGSSSLGDSLNNLGGYQLYDDTGQSISHYFYWYLSCWHLINQYYKCWVAFTLLIVLRKYWINSFLLILKFVNVDQLGIRLGKSIQLLIGGVGFVFSSYLQAIPSFLG